MKNFTRYLISLLILASFAPVFTTNFDPTKDALFFDIDDVVIEKENIIFNVLTHGLEARHPRKSINFIRGLWGIKNNYANKHRLHYKDEQINGLTFHFLYHGMTNKFILPYVAGLVKVIESSRKIIPSTEKTIRYLKEKGYPIIFATNKDRESYEQAAQYLGERFTSLSNKVIVAQPGNNQSFLDALGKFAAQPTTHASYKELYNKATLVEETDTIKHAQGKKPEAPYYNTLLDVAQHYRKIAFFDDKEKNITGFNSMQDKTHLQLYGVHFKKKKPAYLVEQLIELGILSEEEDAAFLHDIRYPGFMGTFKFHGEKILHALNLA